MSNTKKAKEPTLLQVVNRAVHSDDYKAKAIAYFMFREIVEDVHDRISDSEMAELNRRAVDRAHALVKAMSDRNLMTGILLNFASHIKDWDEPRDTEEYRAIMDQANKIASGEISKMSRDCLSAYAQKVINSEDT